MTRGIVRPARRPPGWVAPGPAPAGPQGRPELEPAADEDLCYLAGDWRVFQKLRGHRWSLDDLVTAWVATRTLDPDAPVRALDLGCGLGSVLLMVAWRMPLADVTGIEAQPDRAAMGRRSIAYDGAEARCRIVDGDLRDLVATRDPRDLVGTRDPRDLLNGLRGFDLVTGTPPYFPRGTGTESAKTHAAAARFEHRGGVEDYLGVAAACVAPTGRIVICSSAQERDRVAAGAATCGLAHREQWSVVPRSGKEPLVIVDVFGPRDPAAADARGPRDDTAADARGPRDDTAADVRGPRDDTAADVRGPRDPAAAVRHVLVVRDADGRWTSQFQRVRTDLGMPATPPR